MTLWRLRPSSRPTYPWAKGEDVRGHGAVVLAVSGCSGSTSSRAAFTSS